MESPIRNFRQDDIKCAFSWCTYSISPTLLDTTLAGSESGKEICSCRALRNFTGIEGVKAAITHHMLDYYTDSIKYMSKNKILGKINNRFEDLIYSDSEDISMATREVIGFVVDNLETILNDLRT